MDKIKKSWLLLARLCAKLDSSGYVDFMLLFTEKIVIRVNKKDSRVTLMFEGTYHTAPV